MLINHMSLNDFILTTDAVLAETHAYGGDGRNGESRKTECPDRFSVIGRCSAAQNAVRSPHYKISYSHSHQPG